MDWISIAECKPKIKDNWHSDMVLVCHGNPFDDSVDVWMCYMKQDGSFLDNEGQKFINVTHWMPLPEPPKQ